LNYTIFRLVQAAEYTVDPSPAWRSSLEPCIARAKAYAPFSDLIWMETGTPDLELAKQFADGGVRIHRGLWVVIDRQRRSLQDIVFRARMVYSRPAAG
jgi:hypothetical protein